MAEDTKTVKTDNSGSTTSQSGGGVITDDGIVIDKNKSKEQYMLDAEVKYIVPKLVREKFPDLVKLIYETESMNAEEREYWMQIMPIMTEEQIVKFRDILVNEKSQLSKLDKEYENEVSRINKTQAPAIDEKKLKEKLAQIREEESAHNKEEEKEEADLLKQLEGM